MMRALRVALHVAGADLGRQWRRPTAVAAVLVFGVSCLVVLRLALAGDARPAPAVAAGALWIVLVFASIIATGRAWSAEREDGAYDALLTSPASRSALHAGKLMSTWLTTLALNSVLCVLYLALIGAPPSSRGIALLAVALVLSSLGLCACGVLVAGLGMRARGRDVIGPTMFLPLSIPLVVAAVAVTMSAFDGSDAGGHLMQLVLFMGAYAATFIVAGIAAFPELAVD